MSVVCDTVVPPSAEYVYCTSALLRMSSITQSHKNDLNNSNIADVDRRDKTLPGGNLQDRVVTIAV